MHALVLCCLVTALNALFNHSGATELAVLFGNPLTMEALVYGLVSSLMLLTMWLWCAVWQVWMTNECFLYLFGNLAPTLSLMLSMVFSLIPQSGKKLSQIRLCQRAHPADRKKQRGLLIRQISSLLVMDMEDSMQTADAMRSMCIRDRPGAGAAGGMGYGMLACFGAKLQMGIETVLDTVSFETLAQRADIILTGEGRMDGQSLRGKVVMGIARRAKPLGVPVVAVVGDIGDDITPAYELSLIHISFLSIQ